MAEMLYFHWKIVQHWRLLSQTPSNFLSHYDFLDALVIITDDLA